MTASNMTDSVAGEALPCNPAQVQYFYEVPSELASDVPTAYA